ncbi:glycoside hydrolase superfamily [Tirmania nivea]|nr:glycoside hydrolase superfamily [Tirmania nivea]
MVRLGLKDAGYIYVNIDDCWSLKTRDPITQRIVPDLTKFPDGIKGTAEAVHRLGLKLGIYGDAGMATCAGYPGSLGYEDIDATTSAGTANKGTLASPRLLHAIVTRYKYQYMRII